MFRPGPKAASQYLPIPISDRTAQEFRKQRVMSLVAAGFPLPEGRLFDLLRLLGEPVVDLSRVSERMRAQPRLNGQILGLLRSFPFAEYRQPLALDQAVVLLGSERLRILILGCALADFAGRCLPVQTVRDFWQHGILTALLSERIAREACPGEAERAYLGGLLHDIGRLPLLIVAHEQQCGGAKVPPGVHDQPVLERSYFGVDHGEVGRWIAVSGNFPAWMTALIAHHHDPFEAGEDAALAGLVAVADRHCRTPEQPKPLGQEAQALPRDGGEGVFSLRPASLLQQDRALQSCFLGSASLRAPFPRFGVC